jgi:predicted PurR-regulated permease PerM
MWNPFIRKTKNIFQRAHEKIKGIKKAREEREKKEEKGIKIPKPERRQAVDISTSSVAKAALVIIGILLLAYVLYYIRGILVTFFISIFFAAAINPFVTKMEAKKVPRWLGIFIIYFILVGVIGLLISLIIPILITQIPKIAESIILALGEIFPGIQIDSSLINESVSSIQNYLSNINVSDITKANLNSLLNSASTVFNETWKNTLSIIAGISGGIFNVMLMLVITFFLALDTKGLGKFFVSLFPSKYTPYIVAKAEAIQLKIGEWLLGQLLLSLVIGVTTFIGLSILGVDYAFTLALIAAITEFIPYIGPIIAGIPAILVGLGQGGLFFAFWVFVVTIIVQQIENNIFVPVIMKRSVGLSPVATIFAMMIGYQVLGILGIILAVPIATSIGIFISDYSHRQK